MVAYRELSDLEDALLDLLRPHLREEESIAEETLNRVSKTERSDKMSEDKLREVSETEGKVIGLLFPYKRVEESIPDCLERLLQELEELKNKEKFKETIHYTWQDGVWTPEYKTVHKRK